MTIHSQSGGSDSGKKTTDVAALQAMLARLKGKPVPEAQGPVATPISAPAAQAQPAMAAKTTAAEEKKPSYIPPAPSEIHVEGPMSDGERGDAAEKGPEQPVAASEVAATGSGFGDVGTIKKFIADQAAAAAQGATEAGQAVQAAVTAPAADASVADAGKPAHPEARQLTGSGLVRSTKDLVGFPVESPVKPAEPAQPEIVPQTHAPPAQQVVVEVKDARVGDLIARLDALEDSSRRNIAALEGQLEGTRMGAAFRQNELEMEASDARAREKMSVDALGAIVGAFSEALGNAEALGVVTRPLPEAKNSDMLAPLKAFLGMVVSELSERLPKKGALNDLKDEISIVAGALSDMQDEAEYGMQLDAKTGFENALTILSLRDAVAEMGNRVKHSLPEDDGRLLEILGEVSDECNVLLSMENPQESEILQNRVGAFIVETHGLPADMAQLAPVVNVLMGNAEMVSDALAKDEDSGNEDGA